MSSGQETVVIGGVSCSGGSRSMGWLTWSKAGIWWLVKCWDCFLFRTLRSRHLRCFAMTI